MKFYSYKRWGQKSCSHASGSPALPKLNPVACLEIGGGGGGGGGGEGQNKFRARHFPILLQLSPSTLHREAKKQKFWGHFFNIEVDWRKWFPTPL